MFDFYLGVENRWIAVRVAACDPLRKGQQCDCALECGEDIGAVSPSFFHSAATAQCIYAS